MSRVFWDSMMFIYLLEGHSKFAPYVRQSLERSQDRGEPSHSSSSTTGDSTKSK